MRRAPSLQRVLAESVRRVRLSRAVRAAAWTSVLGCLALGTVVWLLPVGAGIGGLLLLGASALAALLGASWQVDVQQVARRIDRSHGLPDTVQAALQFASSGEDRAGFIAALLREAEASVPRISTARAIPLQAARPAGLALVALLACLVSVTWASPASPLEPVAARVPSRVPAPRPRVAPAASGPRRDVEPVARYQRLARLLAQGALARDEAISALLEVERSLRQREGEALPAGLAERLAALFDAAPPGRRSLAKLSREAGVQNNPEQRQQDARFVEEKRRELEQLRQRHTQDAAAQRELSELSRRLSRAQQALQDNQGSEAQQELDQARQQIEQRQREARAASQVQQQAEQLRELLQRRSASAAGESPEQARRRAENEQRFSAGASAPGEKPRAAPGQAQGQAEEESAGTQAGNGGSDEPAPSDAEPDLFATGNRPRVALEDHAAPSLAAEGESRSEVILSAADRGFAAAPYRRVYADYRDHAEELLVHEQVPPASRFYVRRYFQLIKPRPPRRVDPGASLPPSGKPGGSE